MSWIDIAIVAAMIWFTYAAFRTGMIREVVAMAGVIAAVALAGQFYDELARDVRTAVDNQQASEVIAFAIIFGAVILASQIVAWFLKGTASLLMLGMVDSLGGAVIGFVKGFVFVEIALTLALTFTSLGLKDAVDHSLLAPVFVDVAPVIKSILPSEFDSAINAF